MAKLASTRSKPDGLLVVPAGGALEFLHPLPIEALWGVGERTAETLRRLGLRTVGDLAQAPPAMLRKAVGEAAAGHLHELAWARDPRPVTPGAGREVDPGRRPRSTWTSTIRRSSGGPCSGSRPGSVPGCGHAGQAGRTVAIKVRLADFRTLSRSRTLGTPTDVAREIFDTAWQLYQVLSPRDRIRLLGVRVEGLDADDGAGRQLTLGEREHGWRDAERAADAAAARFGGGVVGPASLLRRDAAREPDPRSRPQSEPEYRSGHARRPRTCLDRGYRSRLDRATEIGRRRPRYGQFARADHPGRVGSHRGGRT